MEVSLTDDTGEPLRGSTGERYAVMALDSDETRAIENAIGGAVDLTYRAVIRAFLTWLDLPWVEVHFGGPFPLRVRYYGDGRRAQRVPGEGWVDTQQISWLALLETREMKALPPGATF